MIYSYFQTKRLDRQVTINNWTMATLAILIFISIIVGFIRIPQLIKLGYILPQEKIKVQTVAIAEIKQPVPQKLTIKGVVAEKQREVSAYNAGDTQQNNENPCIGASGVDICNLLDHGICVYAANFVNLGTYLSVDGIDCQVLDRLNSKYPNRVDIAMKLSDKKQAIDYGIKLKNVRVLKD